MKSPVHGGQGVEFESVPEVFRKPRRGFHQIRSMVVRLERRSRAGPFRMEDSIREEYMISLRCILLAMFGECVDVLLASQQ